VELVWSNARSPQGIVTRRDRLARNEVMTLAGMRATTPVRTAFDLGRLIGGDEGIERLDALGNVARFRVEDVAAVAHRHAGSPGVPRLRMALPMYDAGSESPRETWLRLLLIRAGYPRPRTQIPIFDETGEPIDFLDMGWDDVKIAVEYDGDQHRDRPQWRKDILRSEYLAHLGWTHIRVVAGTRPADVLNRVRRAWASSVRPDRESA
jgi:very-short-patch-repair endonuclease